MSPLRALQATGCRSLAKMASFSLQLDVNAHLLRCASSVDLLPMGAFDRNMGTAR